MVKAVSYVQKTANFSNLYQARSQTMPIGATKNFTGAGNSY